LGWTYCNDWTFRWSEDPQNSERAFELAQRARALDDSLPNAHLLLSFIYLWGKKQPEQAIAEGERTLALDPNYADSYVVLADVPNHAGRPADAIGLAEKAVRLDPRGPGTTFYLWEVGFAYRLTGRVEGAIATQKQVLLHDPNYPHAYAELAFSYVLQWAWQLSQDSKTLEQASASAQKAISLDDSLPWSHMALGKVYLWQKQHEQARVEAERAIALYPNRADGYATLADILNTAGKPEEAIGVMEKVTGLSSNPLFLFDLGHAYCLTERYEEAIDTLKKMIVRYPHWLHAHLILAIAYNELGREEGARAAAAEVLRLNPNFSLEVWRRRVPYRDPAVVECQVAALRKAGLK
jgi:tetratricopeptide (TPR) repeat protein